MLFCSKNNALCVSGRGSWQGTKLQHEDEDGIGNAGLITEMICGKVNGKR